MTDPLPNAGYDAVVRARNGLHALRLEVHSSIASDLRKLVEAALAQAWDEGWDQGASDAWMRGGHKAKPNPYTTPLPPADGGTS